MKKKHRSVKIQVLLTLVFVFVTLFLTSQAIAKPVDKAKSGKVVKTFLKIEQLRKEKKGEKILKSIQKHKLENTTPIYGKNGELLAWVTELKPEGYVVTSADDRINPIISYSFKGKFPFKDAKQNVLLHMIQWDMEARQKAINEQPVQLASRTTKNNEKWADYSSDGIVAMESMIMAETASTQTQWPDPIGYGSDGWIKTNWDQGTPYNNNCPDNTATGEKCAVGCVATASVQIINYWKYPTQVDFDTRWWFGDDYTSDGDLNGDGRSQGWEEIDIDGDAGGLNFQTFEELNVQLSQVNYSDPEDISSLCFGLGVKVGMNYGDQSGANTYKVAKALRQDFSYGSAMCKTNAWSSKAKNSVIDNIKKSYPVQIGARGPDGGHSIVVDGYRSSDEMFHLNLGWANVWGTNTWYDLPVFEAAGLNFTLVHTVIYDIAPYFGWHQSGADEENSFRTIYNAPTTDPPIDKWQVTCRSDYFFNGLAVGMSGKIYASCSPTNGSGSDHPSIWVINQYGEKEKEIELLDENEGVTYPAQNSEGEIFVSTDLGRVYRVDTKTDTETRIFTEPDGEQFFYPVKIDDDDNIYVATLYKLYSLTRTGSVRWTFDLPNNVWFLYRLPAIDSSRDRVYIGYYDFDTDIPYLASIHRNTGTEVHRKAFPTVTTISRSIGIPSVGDDGTVYVGSYKTLYALEPDTLAQKWATPAFRSTITRAPAIGSDGTLYVPYWNERGGIWYLAFGAFNSTNGSLKWEVERISYDDYDNFGQPYIASNNVVVFPFLMENGSNPDTVEIFAYRDNGTTYEHLWNKNFNTSGGEFAFGPGATLYAWPTSGYGHTIYAVSEGDVGDPDGGGMAFTDNIRPNLPATPTPIDGANDVSSSVTLSWSCSDPEGHSIKYSLFIGESGYDMVPVATDITSTSYQLTGLEPLTSYRWMIVATDGQAVSDGPTWVFTTDVSADIYKDDKVNLQDYAVLAKNWKATDCNELNDWCEKADIDKSGTVDFNDLLIMTEYWLEGAVQQNEPDGMVHIPASTFQMGDNLDGSYNAPVHTVTLDSFYINPYTITNAQYCQYLNSVYGSSIYYNSNGVVYGNGNNKMYFFTSAYTSNSQIAFANNTFSVLSKGGKSMANYPVGYASWYGSLAYCNWRSQQEGCEQCYNLSTWACDFNKNGYRLPTEAEWEYAARGGLSGKRFPWGDTITHSQANYYSMSIYPYDISPTRGYHPDWNDGFLPYLSPVGSFSSNGFGLYDMAGNVWEWCYDWYSSSYYSSSPSTNPTGPATGTYRVMRGGHYYGDGGSKNCRVANRGYTWADNHYYHISGFRVCRNTLESSLIAYHNGSSPTIDGVLSDGEWGSSYTVTMDRRDGGGQHDINLYFQNDGTYLFVGVDSQWESGWDVVWDILIDGDYSRTLNGNLSQPYTDIGICQQSPTGYSGYRAYRTMLSDISFVRVGYDSGADSASSGSTNVSYEFRIPLADLDVITGDSIGLIITHGYDGIAEHLYELSLSVSRATPENWATLQIVP